MPIRDRHAERHAMVRRQLQGRDITDRRVCAALGAIPREHFVPGARASEAYADHPLPIGLGQTISQPYIVALMTQAAYLTRRSRVLEIGGGSGYHAAVLGKIADRVWSVERLPDLAADARARLRSLGIDNVHVLVGDGRDGYSAAALRCHPRRGRDPDAATCPAPPAGAQRQTRHPPRPLGRPGSRGLAALRGRHQTARPLRLLFRAPRREAIAPVPASVSLLGAHVSTAGGVTQAPARARAIGATAMQIFTKTPNQWREPEISADTGQLFRQRCRRYGVRAIVAHDSYLINLASPDRPLRQRSLDSFVQELRRCRTLGIRYVVSHPGNYMDHPGRGLVRNAAAYAEALERVPGPMVLIETTAGGGTALGARFEELAELRDRVPLPFRRRIACCADTCHLFVAGYDLRETWHEVWARWDRSLGRRALRCLHLNDAVASLGSRRDRHALIGEGTIGPEPFRRLMREPRFARTVKVIETPKGDDPVRTDRRMLRRLRAYARTPWRHKGGAG
jgi:deoxyribonuclease-4